MANLSINDMKRGVKEMRSRFPCSSVIREWS